MKSPFNIFAKFTKQSKMTTPYEFVDVLLKLIRMEIANMLQTRIQSDFRTVSPMTTATFETSPHPKGSNNAP